MARHGSMQCSQFVCTFDIQCTVFFFYKEAVVYFNFGKGNTDKDKTAFYFL